ncbi:hypothetical protein KY349_03870 [Candidatus Woesearchaeota archaeon]|nr:hypothetical protein [Candidatus Woesearchaeota archaeon]
MAIKKKKQVEKLKKQDKALAKLPSLEKEKKSFKKGESLLERLLVKKKMRAVKPKTKPAKSRSKKR